MAYKNNPFEVVAGWVTKWTGSSWALGLAVATIVIWVVTGPLFDFNDTWQLVINTGTTIITFLMVFLIQRSQNKDSQAVHIKLNELVAAQAGASNRLIAVEDLSEKEIATLHQHFCKLAELAQEDKKIDETHSVEEASDRHEEKKATRGDDKGAARPARKRK